ncbi:MAG TPA: S8 family serine peptidase, partial [Candidatus Cloacimonadota bacterium]|nr:S8 family serine peptidase [Candidatus Cloacimonadota bacterium]
MRKYTLVLVFMLMILCLTANARQGIDNQKRPPYAPNLIKIKLSVEAVQRAQLPLGLYAERSDFGINELDQLMAVNGGKAIIRAHREVNDKAWQEKTGFDRWFLIRLDGTSTVLNALASFKDNRFVEEAIPEFYAYTTAVPNDTYYTNNWGHNNTAQLPVYSGSSHSGAGVGTIGYDADMQLAWDQSQGYGSSSVIIAIIDTGVDTTHPDLRLVAGYDYGVGDSNPMDDSADPGHGTSCAGVAAAMANNALGITGAAGGCSVMPLKIASADGSLGFTAIENALTHCGDHNVDVASMSFGAEGGMAEGDSPTTDTALEYAYSHGVTLLAATANANTSAIAYPSNHNKVISVGASSPTGQRKSTTSSDGENWWGSNYGTAVQDDQLAVDICAPTILPSTDLVGSVGYSTNNYYMWFNGTSCATPYAAGVTALIISKDPSLTPAQVRTALTSTCTDMTFDGGAGWDRYTGYGMVNANSALNSLVPGMPSCTITAPLGGAVLDLNSTVTVNVTATDTDGTITQVAFYVDDVLKNTDTASPWTWNWNTTGSSGGSHTIKAIATDNAANTAISTVTISLLAPPSESFETGNFSAFPWLNTSAIPWTVQSSDKFSGTYAARSGAISHSAVTDLSITLNITSAGNISFYQKISSEATYDFLYFYIDGVQQGSWSGAGSWTNASYPVTTGSHIFKWTYSKDINTVGNSDCAFLDHIIFPPYTIPITFYPPQNLSAAAGSGFVNLSWQAPLLGTPTGYKIYRNSSLLTTVTGLSYTDNAVVNGTTYNYYLIAAYAGGNSDPTATVSAT